MIKKYLSLVVLSIILVSETSMLAPKAVANINSQNSIVEPENKDGERHKDKKKCEEHHKHDMKMLCDDKYLKYLSDDEKKNLKSINECVEKGQELSKDQIKIIITSKDKIFKTILGEKDYTEFKKLMKKHKDGPLSNDDKCKMEEYHKKIKECK